MADAAVRVDIVVGQNTVVPAADQTGRALVGLNRTAGALNGGFENLSKTGLRRLEAGMQALAFEAAGVPGPLGKIASGLTLLAGGSGLLLGVAVAAGTVGLAWQKLTAFSAEAKAAIDDMTAALNKMTKAQQNVAAATEQMNKELGKAGFFASLAAMIPGAQALANYFGKSAAGIQTVIQKYEELQAKIGDKNALHGPKAKAVSLTDLPTLDFTTNQAFTSQSVMLALTKQAAELNAQFAQVPLNVEGVNAAIESMQAPFDAATERTQQFASDLNSIVVGGIMGLAAGIGAALSGQGNIATVLLGALGQAFQDFGAAIIAGSVLIKSALAALASLNPVAAIGLGAALIALGAMLSGAAQKAFNSGPRVSASTASGGVNSSQMSQDQADMHPGTVTVRLGSDGFIDPRNPVFQDFLAQVIKEAKGRNVVFA